MGRAVRRAIDGLLQLYCIRVYSFPDLVAAREARREKREERWFDHRKASR